MANCHPFFIHIFSFLTMKIAITGISGHIGNTIARALLIEDFSIIALVRKKDKPSVQDLSIELVEGDLFNDSALDLLCKEADVLIHLAGKISIYEKDESEVLKTNIEGVKNIIDACIRNGVKKVIHFSSIHAHKPVGLNKILNEHTPYEDDRSIFYNYSKSIGEQTMIKARGRGLDVSIINPTGGFGPFDFHPSLSGKMILDIYNGKLPIIVKGGYDWVDLRDISNAVLSIIKLNVVNEKFILSGHWADLKTFAVQVCSFKNKPYNGLALPLWICKIGLPFISIYSRIINSPPLYTSSSLKTIEEGSKRIENTHAKELLNYSPRPLNESIRDTIIWFKQNNKI